MQAQMEQELNEDPLERKRRMEKLQLERDLENAADLFGTNGDLMIGMELVFRDD